MYNGRTDNEDKSQHGLSGIEMCSFSALYHLLALMRTVNVGIREYDINAECAAHRGLLPADATGSNFLVRDAISFISTRYPLMRLQNPLVC